MKKIVTLAIATLLVASCCSHYKVAGQRLNDSVLVEYERNLGNINAQDGKPLTKSEQKLRKFELKQYRNAFGIE